MERRVLRDRHGNPIYPIGVNYWPRRTAVEMWSRWDPNGIDKDLQEMQSLGLNTVRFFLRTEDFADSEANLKPDAIGKLDAFLGMCQKHNLHTMPTFFVGHMSGMNFPIPWEQGRDFYTDPEVVARSRRFVRSIVSRYRDDETVLGWLLSNEITNHTGKRETHVLLGWMREIRDAIRSVDPDRPVAPGDGADDLKGNGLGYPEGALGNIDEMAEGEDFVSLHHYYSDNDPVRFFHAPAAAVRLCDIGLPVLVEEFGVSTALWPESAQAEYFRILLFSTWAAGAAGALAWCWSDFGDPGLPPYTHHPHELFFGITRSDGSEKPAAGEISRFAGLMSHLDATRWHPRPARVGILVPTTFYVNYPFRNPDRGRILKALLESYTLVKASGLDAVFVREGESVPSTVRLLLAPYADLLASSWEYLEEWTRDGGHLWAGFANAVPNLQSLFGVRLGGSLSDFMASERNDKASFLHMVGKLGSLGPGAELYVPPAVEPYLPTEPAGADLLASDRLGRPAITVNMLGNGKAYFASYSMESSATVRGRLGLLAVYRALAKGAGVLQDLSTSTTSLGFSVLEDNDGNRLLVVLNHGDGTVESDVRARMPLSRLVDVERGDDVRVVDGIFRLRVDPWEVRILEGRKSEAHRV